MGKDAHHRRIKAMKTKVFLEPIRQNKSADRAIIGNIYLHAYNTLTKIGWFEDRSHNHGLRGGGKNTVRFHAMRGTECTDLLDILALREHVLDNAAALYRQAKHYEALEGSPVFEDRNNREPRVRIT